MAEYPERLIETGRWCMEQAINRALAMDPASRQRLAGLAGRRLRLRLEDPAVELDVHFGEERVALRPSDQDVVAEASVETTLAGLASLAASRGQRSRDVVFRGDIGTIQSVRQLVANLEIDWEEQLSRITGDSLAHTIGEGLRRGHDWAGYAGDRLLTDVGEYVTEERRLLPTEPEVTGFADAVRRLRADVDRLEARLKRLERGSRS